MGFLNSVWKKITNTAAIEAASGKYEIYFFEFIYKVIYLCGLSTSESSIAYTVYSIIVKFILISLVYCEMWNFFNVTLTMETITEGINVILIQFATFSKYRVMVTNKSVFKSLASSMLSENFDVSTENRKRIVETWGKRNDASLKLLLSLGSLTLLAWYIYPLTDDLDYNLIVPINLPFDYQTPTLYPLTYLLTMILFPYECYFVMAIDLMVQVHLMHLLCQYDVLNDCFTNILIDCQSNFTDINQKFLHLDVDFSKSYKKKLGNLVNQHIFILNNTLKLRDLMSTPMLIQLATSTTLICSIGFQLTTSVDVNVSKGIMSLLFLGYNMFTLYIICRWCEEIKIQGEKIGDAVYCSGWENGIVNVPGVRTSIMLILARANTPATLTAGGMYELSLKSYANMVKTSYSALTVLLRFR